MARIDLASRQAIADGEKEAYDAFIESRQGRANNGPYSLIAHLPEVAHRLEALRTYLRGEQSLPQNLQELVMITLAREMDCAFIWYAHAAEARQIGVRGSIIDDIRERRELVDLQADEQVVVNFTRELLRERKVSSATFDAATARLANVER